MSLDFTIQLAGESGAANAVIADGLTRIQSEYFDELSVGSLQFSLSENDVLTLEDLVSPDAIEIPLVAPDAARPNALSGRIRPA